ncbi:MAG: DUF2283 domain-containing protein [Gemmatales bacterium]
MKTYNFQIRVQVLGATGELSAAYFRFREGKVSKTVEVANGKAFADYSTSGKLLGIELIAPCKLNVISGLAVKKDRKPITDFVRNSAPRALVPA